MKRGGPLSRQSKKFRKRKAEAAPAREDLAEKVDRCERCYEPFRNYWLYKGQIHEIANAHARQSSLDQPGCCLKVCGFCHKALHERGKAGKLESLAWLKIRRPDDYDLALIHRLRLDNWPTAEEVDLEVELLLEKRA